ncbi:MULTISPECIES: ZIP family metal transporter [Actinobacillus]|uniref:ZIP family metal transporter n=1 Tax=Actinobacillus porcitonsillarum TaxID=189834 RepID=A0A2U8FLN9_9PAST|nr:MULTISPECIES: ZIP family metal transporter [Actinobacillus]AWI51899.1 ZIP family metal transporter [Actinobacillus porcitonsillarum]MDD6910723.1 ZIP family metal transporter [Actinobacillus minor]MDY4713127.1 ZIP family metal transporter [Actinobacillus minor]
MFDYFLSLHPIMQAFIAGLFTWGCTIFGSSFVYFFKTVNRKLLDMMMGFAGGVMIAASFWSLLAPALEYAEADYGSLAWLPAAIGFLLGGFFIRLIDYVVPHLHLSKPIEEAEGMQPKKGLSKSMLLFLAITIHNIPEGLAIGVTFGALATQVPGVDASIMGAIGLAIGIGLQNIPEGSSLSLPIRGEGHSRWKAFWYGSMSAVVEPIAAVIGAAFVLSMTAILPYALAFAAGAMIFVVVEELIPESQSNGNTDIATLSLMVGFVVMMVLDVALG